MITQPQSKPKRVPVEMIFAASLACPILLQLLGFLLDYPFLSELGGKVAVVVVVLLVIVAVSSAISWRRFLQDSGRRALRVRNCINSLRDDAAYRLTFRDADGERLTVRYCDNSFLISREDNPSTMLEEEELVSRILVSTGNLELRNSATQKSSEEVR